MSQASRVTTFSARICRVSNLNSLSCLGISDDEQTITLITVVPVYLIVLFYWFLLIRKRQMRKGVM